MNSSSIDILDLMGPITFGLLALAGLGLAWRAAVAKSFQWTAIAPIWSAYWGAYAWAASPQGLRVAPVLSRYLLLAPAILPVLAGAVLLSTGIARKNYLVAGVGPIFFVAFGVPIVAMLRVVR